MATSRFRLALAGILILATVPVQSQTQVWTTPSRTSTWSDNLQLVPADSAAPPEGKAAAGTPSRLLAVGDKVRVAWTGGWYDATVLALGDGRYRVHYDGWDASWDEWVDASRMRLADGSAVAAPPRFAADHSASAQQAPALKVPVPTPAPATEKVWSSHPAGHWSCRTWDYGQVNRVGEFALHKDGSYRDIMYGGSGRYDFDPRRNTLAFRSGPQKTSYPVRFNAAGHAGKGHLIFDYGGGARLDCYREALP